MGLCPGDHARDRSFLLPVLLVLTAAESNQMLRIVIAVTLSGLLLFVAALNVLAFAVWCGQHLAGQRRRKREARRNRYRWM